MELPITDYPLILGHIGQLECRWIDKDLCHRPTINVHFLIRLAIGGHIDHRR